MVNWEYYQKYIVRVERGKERWDQFEGDGAWEERYWSKDKVP